MLYNDIEHLSANHFKRFLIADKRFYLPGKKALLREENNFEVVLIDVTESPVERPKNNHAEITPQKETAQSKNASSCREEKKKSFVHRLTRVVSTISGFSQSQEIGNTRKHNSRFLTTI